MELVSTILSYGGQVLHVEPAELREILANEIEKMAASFLK
mgnify:CR=1 FL=1